MHLASVILIVLIVATPVVLVFDGPIVHGLVTLVAALSVAIVALRIRISEADFLSSVFTVAAIASAVPASWMLIQILPLMSIGLANPIWQSAAVALGRLPGGSISIDPGATIVALAQYLSMVSIAFVATAVSIDRDRARNLLLALTVATTLVALMALATKISVFTLLGKNEWARNAATECASLGALLAISAVLYETGVAQARDRSTRALGIWHRSVLVGRMFAAAICCLAVVATATAQAYFAVACGVATVAIAIVIRKLHLGPWGHSAIVAIASVIAIAVVTFHPSSRSSGLILAFASQAPAPLITLTQRVLAEIPWTGTGAGTFAAVLPIFRDVYEINTANVAPNAVAKTAVEMGHPFLFASLLAALALVVSLLRGAARRRRDWLYSTAGASSIVTIVLLSFGNTALFSSAVGLVAAASVGLGIAQIKSRAA